MALMTERHFRHLPVIHEQKLVGLVSIGDLVKDVMSEQSSSLPNWNAISGERVRRAPPAGRRRP